MKKIPVWLTVALSVVTLFYYQYYWFGVQRKYLIKETGAKIPSNWWLVASAAGSVVYMTGLAAAIFWPGIHPVVSLLILTLLGFVLMFSLIVYIWWIIIFFKAADVILKPRVTFGWILAYIILITFAVVFVAQYYFNRKPTGTQTKPSTAFVAWSIVAISSLYVLLVGATAIGTFLYIQTPEFSNEIQLLTGEDKLADDKEYNALGEKTVFLEKKYAGCVETLDANFPTVTEENEAAYLAGYDACEAIRLEQNKAVDDLNALRDQILNP